MRIESKDLQYLWYELARTFLRVDLGFGELINVAIYNEEGDPIPQSVLDVLSYIKANRETFHEQCRKLLFDFIQKAANDDNSGYDFDVDGDWDLLEILEDGESAELIEDYIKFDTIEFDPEEEECRIHYETAWDHHGMEINLDDNYCLRLL